MQVFKFLFVRLKSSKEICFFQGNMGILMENVLSLRKLHLMSVGLAIIYRL